MLRMVKVGQLNELRPCQALPLCQHCLLTGAFAIASPVCGLDSAPLRRVIPARLKRMTAPDPS